jgi:hypothetical protein
MKKKEELKCFENTQTWMVIEIGEEAQSHAEEKLTENQL